MTSPGPSLTPRQTEVLAFVRDFSRRERMSPTLAEVAEHAGVCWTRAWQVVDRLIQLGLLERPGQGVGHGRSPSRTLRPTIAEAGPVRVDRSSWTPAVDSSGGVGVAYRMTKPPTQGTEA